MDIRKAAWFAAIGNYASLALQFCTVVIATRLLSKDDIGGFAVASAIFNILIPFVDFGISRYVVHLNEISAGRLRPAAAVSWVVSICTWSVLWLSAGYIGEFFGQSDLAFALRIMSVNLCLYPVMVIGGGRLSRDMRQDWIASIQVGRSATQTVVSIGLMLAEYKLKSLAIGFAAGFAFELVLISLVTWHASLVPLRLKGIADVLLFGFFSSGTSVVTQVGNGTPDLAIGKMLGLADAGIYSRSMALVGLIKRGIDTVTVAVALPGFSKLIREGADPRPMYIATVEITSGLTWPVLAVLIVLADPIVGILYGPRWPEVVAITRLAALTQIGLAVASSAGPFLIAIRREAILFRIEFATQVVKAVLVCLGAQFSLRAAMIALIFGSLLQLGILVGILSKTGGVSINELAASSKRSVPLCIAAAAGAMLGVISGLESQLAMLAVGSAGALISWLLVVFMSDHPLRVEVDRIFNRVQQLAS